MRQTLFTTYFLEFDRQFHSAVWLRVGLQDWMPDMVYRHLDRRNRRFEVSFFPLPVKGPSDEQEELYQRYRQAMPFEPAPTLKDLLYGDAFHNLFPTWVAELRDGGKLIAGGLFDLGDQGAAGISSFYDPAYKKYSLGKYLIYKKMLYCQDRGAEWYYPGYAAPGQPRFDYKWAIGASTLEFLDLETGLWLFRDTEEPIPDPLRVMEEQLARLKPFWARRLPAPALRRYLHLDINLNPQVRGMGLFDFPVFVDCFPLPGRCPVAVIVFDPRDGQYHLYQTRSVYRFDKGLGSDPTIFESDLLLADQDLFSSNEPAEVVAVLDRFTVSRG